MFDRVIETPRRIVEGVQAWINPSPFQQTIQERGRELQRLGRERKLLEKLQWHRGLGRVETLPIPPQEIDKFRYFPRITSTYGTNAKGILYTEGHGAVFEHQSGRYKGLVVGVKGGILDRYREMGGPVSYLGLPISDEQETPEGWRSDFEEGSLVVTKEPWRIQQIGRRDQEDADFSARWSELDLKRVTEPMGETQKAAPSFKGTQGVYREFKDMTTDQLVRHAIILHTSGNNAGKMVYVYGYDYEYYLSQGGTRLELGFPLPTPKVEMPGRTVTKFEGGDIVWTQDHGFSTQLKARR